MKIEIIIYGATNLSFEPDLFMAALYQTLTEIKLPKGDKFEQPRKNYLQKILGDSPIGFSSLLERAIEVNFDFISDYFASKSDFEKQLRDQIESAAVVRVLKNIDSGSLRQFLQNLEDQTIQVLLSHLRTKFGASFIDYSNEILKVNQAIAPQMKIEIIIYGATNLSFEPDLFMAALYQTLTEIKLPKGDKFEQPRKNYLQKSLGDSPIEFSSLLERAIEVNFDFISDYFTSKSDFEKKLRDQIEIRGSVIEVFTSSGAESLRVFLQTLSAKTIGELKNLVSQKLGKKFIECSNDLLSQNKPKSSDIFIEIILYGLTNLSFDIPSFISFIQHNIPELIVSDPNKWDPRSIPEQNHRYIESFIYFLLYRRFLIPQLEEDGPQKALIKIISSAPQIFRNQLRVHVHHDRILQSLVGYLPENRLDLFFDKLSIYFVGKLEIIWNMMPPLRGLKKADLTVALLSLDFKIEKRIHLSDIVTLLIEELKEYSSSELTVETPVSEVLFSESFDEIPAQVLLDHGIALEYRSIYNDYDLLHYVVKNGTFPRWSRIRTAREFYDVLNLLLKRDQSEFKSQLNDISIYPQSLLHLSILMGPQYFLKLAGLINPGMLLKASQTSKKLAEVFKYFAASEQLGSYFLINTVLVMWKIPAAKEETIISELIDYFIDDSLYSRNEVLAVYRQSSDQMGLVELSQSEYNEETSLVIIDGKSDIDFTLYAIVYRQLPWWVSQLEYASEPIDKMIERLSKELLGQKPKAFINEISKSRYKENIFQQIIPIIEPQNVGRILLILSPRYGAFLNNFNILLTRSLSKKIPDQWYSYLFQKLSTNLAIIHQNFLQEAIQFLAQIFSMDRMKLRDQIIKTVRKAVEEGELKFLPFVSLMTNQSQTEVTLQEKSESDPSRIKGDFNSLLIYYLSYGSLPVDKGEKITNYLEFITRLQTKLIVADVSMRLEILSLLSQTKIRTRVLRNEKEDFLKLLLAAVFPDFSKELIRYQEQLFYFLKRFWPSLSDQVIKEIFYASTFEQILNSNFYSLKLEDITRIVLKKYKDTYRISYDILSSELSTLDLDPMLIDLILAESEKAKPVKETAESKSINLTKDINDQEDLIMDDRIMIQNAGIILIWPYLSKYFDMLGMTEKGDFKSDDEAIKGVHLLQYIATGLEDPVSEHELLLNKVLCGVGMVTPIPMTMNISDVEKETSEMMLNGVLQNWNKLKSSSIDALRDGFLMREGYLEEGPDSWQLDVEKKTLDILLNSLPWGYGNIKLSWMKKRLIVTWA